MSLIDLPSPEPPPPPPARHPLRNLLLGGLLVLAPAYLTVYVLTALFRFMDGIFAPLIDRAVRTLLHERTFHIPGLGIVLTLLVILFLGWLSERVIGRRILGSVEGFIRRIPVAKSVYGATKGVLEAVSRDQAEAFKRVVLIEYPRRGIYGIAFVTGGGTRWGDDPRVAEDLVPVFVPTTPNPTSGFLLLVPPAEIVECSMTVEEGVRMIVSGGILQPQAILDQALSPAVAEPELASREA